MVMKCIYHNILQNNYWLCLVRNADRERKAVFKSPLFFRFLDEFGDGFGMAQAISYVDHSQLLTYMALEERLAQAMEVSEFYAFLF